MSYSSQVAVFPPVSRRGPLPAFETVQRRERPLLRVLAFLALALYGVLRWGELLSPAPTWRLLGLLAISLALVGAGAALGTHNRTLLAVLAVFVVLAAFPLAGVPARWVVHVRIAVTARGIEQGLSALPRVLVPYSGINEWVRVVMVLGAAVLLLDGALLLAFAAPGLGDFRRAGAALPLIALAVVPSTLMRPRWPYLHGLLLFALLALFMWGERIRRDHGAAALAVCAVAGVVGLAAAPSLDTHKPWVNYEAFASNFAPAQVDTFDWSQRYGPLNWPQAGHAVLDVQAKREDYWKAENLDTFDGRGWATGTVSGASALFGVDAASRRQWTQTVTFTIRSMRSPVVIAAGAAVSVPTHLPAPSLPGESPGTWAINGELGPGDSYAVTTYSPHPSARQLRHAGGAYPQQIAGYLQMTLPGFVLTTHQTPVAFGPHDVYFAPFHSRRAFSPLSTVDFPEVAIEATAYARMFNLARSLARHSRTPYDYVLAVKSYLAQGFTYNQNPPQRQYPLVGFLFDDKVGYCQQFAGAMALLLRMGGVPARVAVGFTPGRYDRTTHRWVVTDIDAHAWVEAWFPHYGWVRTPDPTPAAAPALSPIEPGGDITGPTAATHQLLKHHDIGGATARTRHAHRGGSSSTGWELAVLVLLLLSAGGLLLTFRRAPATEQELLAELERAFARSGRPISDGVTLASLEQRFTGSPDAAGYVRAIRLARFGAGARPPSRRQRRALRTELCGGIGVGARLRGLWAVPPRRHARRGPRGAG